MNRMKRAAAWMMRLAWLVLTVVLLAGCAGTDGTTNKETAEYVRETESLQASSHVSGKISDRSSEGGESSENGESRESGKSGESGKYSGSSEESRGGTVGEDSGTVDEDGVYDTREEVALYLHTYGHLPGNYITKKDAEAAGWSSEKGNLWDVAPGKSIGGSRFGNYEGQLPEKKGRKYFECDLEYNGGYRGAKRLVYSNDGLIFYTEDHYNTFEQLY